MPNNFGNDFLAALGDSGPLDNQITQYNNASQNNVSGLPDLFDDEQRQRRFDAAELRPDSR